MSSKPTKDLNAIVTHGSTFHENQGWQTAERKGAATGSARPKCSAARNLVLLPKMANNVSVCLAPGTS